LFVNILVFASVCKKWIRDCLRETEDFRVILPHVNLTDLILFLTHLQNPILYDQESPVIPDPDSLKCAIMNLSPYFNVDSLLEAVEIEDDVSDSMTESNDLTDNEHANETIDLNDLNEKTIQHNFSDQEGRLVCLICYKIFKRNNFDFFKAHFKTHPQTLWPRIEIIKSAVKKCENCDYTCKDTAQLNAHSKIHLQKRFTCLSCRRDFGSEKIMKRHSCVSNRQCQICHHIFSDSTRLKYHMKVHTGANKRYECEICSKTFTELRSLKEHKVIHDPSRKFNCQHCQKGFSQKNHLRYHLASKHGVSVGETSHDCDVCKKKFAFAFQLKKHHDQVHKGVKIS